SPPWRSRGSATRAIRPDPAARAAATPRTVTASDGSERPSSGGGPKVGDELRRRGPWPHRRHRPPASSPTTLRRSHRHDPPPSRPGTTVTTHHRHDRHHRHDPAPPSRPTTV